MESRIGIFGSRGSGGVGRSAEIKAWVRRAFGLGEEVTITVAELRCTEPGCPPVETVVGILGGPGGARRIKVHKPAAEVAYEDVARLASGVGRAEKHDEEG